MLATLYNMHVIAHILGSHHMPLPFTHCHLSLEINLLKIDLNPVSCMTYES